jgi:competence protein ComEC
MMHVARTVSGGLRRFSRPSVLALAVTLAGCSGGKGPGQSPGLGSGGNAGNGAATGGASGGTGTGSGSGGTVQGTGGSATGGAGPAGPGGFGGRPQSTGGGGEAGRNAGTGGGSSGGAGGVTGAGGGPATAGGLLRIFWIDVEGGASTIIAMPSGEVVVMDAGSSSAHAQRVMDVLSAELHASRIDALIVSHYHSDHVGGVPSLAALIPIGEYFDHGAAVESGGYIDTYLSMFSKAGAPKRTVVIPGTVLKFGSIELTFVTSAGEVVEPPLPTAVANPTCGSATSKSALGGAENALSVGFVVRYGNFDFLDTGDLTWNAEQKLVCPTNRVGVVDLYQVNHHGMDLSSSPQLVHSIAPLVAVMNNGAAKGGSPATFEVLKASPGFKDLWSLHRVRANDAAHNAEDELTANLDGTDRAYWIEAVVDAGGSYMLKNSRSGMSRTYQAR